MFSSNSHLFDGARVLLVEDSMLIAMDAANELRDLGCEVLGPCGNLEDALEEISQARSIDLALLDINLGPQETSLPLVPELLDRQVPILFLTGYNGELVLPKHLRGIPLLDKPIDKRRLILEMENIFESTRSCQVFEYAANY